jgi:hypothetical protein
MFNYPIKTCDEDTFLYYLQRVLRFFTTREGTPQRLLHDPPLRKSQRILRRQPVPPRKLRSVPTVAECRGT